MDHLHITLGSAEGKFACFNFTTQGQMKLLRICSKRRECAERRGRCQGKSAKPEDTVDCPQSTNSEISICSGIPGALLVIGGMLVSSVTHGITV